MTCRLCPGITDKIKDQYAENNCKFFKPKSRFVELPCSVGHLEEMSIIVKEHCDMLIEDEIILDCSSTVGLKWLLDGKLHGEYVRIMKPSLTVDEVVETTNLLLHEFVCMNETKKPTEGESDA